MEENNNEQYNQENIQQVEGQVNQEPVQPVEEQQVNQEPVQSEKPKGRAFTIILILIIIALVGYIVWDKTNNKEEPTPIKDKENTNENVLEPENQVTHNYFKTETVNKVFNGKNTKIEIKYWLEKLEIEYDEDGEIITYMDDTVGYFVNGDLYVNDKYINCIGKFDVSDSRNMNEENVLNQLANNNFFKEYIEKTKQFEVIKGDKDYFYTKTYDGKLTVFNDSGKVIFDKTVEELGREVVLDKTCPNHQKFVNQYNVDNDFPDGNYNTALYFVENNIIYYVEDPLSCTKEIAAQYKVTFSNDEAHMEKLAECAFEGEGACS